MQQVLHIAALFTIISSDTFMMKISWNLWSCANNEIYKPFLLNFRAQGAYLAKMDNLPKHHGAGPNAVASA